MQLPLFALPSLLLAATSLLAAADAYERNDEDLLKRLAAPPWSPKLSKRTDGPGSRTAAQLRKRQQFGCSNGYEQCPGLRYCCQAGLTCFSDGTCGTVDQLTCMAGETVCGPLLPPYLSLSLSFSSVFAVPGLEWDGGALTDWNRKRDEGWLLPDQEQVRQQQHLRRREWARASAV